MSAETASHAAKVESLKRAAAAAEEGRKRQLRVIRAERASGREEEEKLERERSGYQERADLARRHIARLEKDLKEEQTKVGLRTVVRCVFRGCCCSCHCFLLFILRLLR